MKINRHLLGYCFLLFSLLAVKGWSQTSYTITYTGLTGSTTPTGVPAAVTIVSQYAGVQASCVTSSNGTTDYPMTMRAATGYRITISQISGTAYASSAGAKDFNFQLVNNGNTYTSNITTIGSSSNCGGNTAIAPLNVATGAQTMVGDAVITVVRGAGTGYSWTKTLVITGTYTAIATKLGFGTMPTTGTVGNDVSSFTVSALKADNSVDATFTGNITIAKVTGPGTMGGTLTKAAVNGVATFDNIDFNTAGTYTISATSSGLTSATSGNIVISSATSAATDYFRSKQSGDWNSTSTWESSANNSTWMNATLIPGSAANTITIQAAHTVTATTDLTVSNTTVAGKLNIAPGISLTIPAAKTVNATSGTLTLKSDNAGTASIATGNAAGNYITGNIYVERYIPGGLRKYRFLGHPFSSGLNIQQVADSIDITGSITGINADNFTATASNNPSAFVFDESIDDGVTGNSNNAGWVALSSANTATTIAAGQGLRVLIRGSKGQAGSLTGGTYTPDAVTLVTSGIVTQGDFTQNLQFTDISKGWNLVSNPYPSNVNWDGVTKNNVNDAIYTYRPALSGGNYASYINGSGANGGSQYIETGSSFFVRSNAASPSLGWHETDKVLNDPTNSTFRITHRDQSAIHNRISLLLINNTTNNTDEVVVRFGDDKATDHFDAAFDALNISGAAQDLFVADDQQTKYSIYHGSELNSIPGVEKREVKLGINYLVAGNYTITAKTLNAFVNNNIAYLKDAELNTLTEISDSTAYPFTIATGTTSTNRFSIVFNAKEKPAPVVMQTSIKLSPNPVKDKLYVTFSNLDDQQNTVIRIVNAEGKTVKTIQVGKISNGLQTINTSDIVKGFYTVQILNGEQKQSQNIIKQ